MLIVPQPELSVLLRTMSVWAIIYTFPHARMGPMTIPGLYLSPCLCHPAHTPVHVLWLHLFPWGETTVLVCPVFPQLILPEMWDLTLVHANLRVPSRGRLSPLARAALYLCSKKVLVHLNMPPEQREGLTNFYTGKLAFIPIMRPMSLYF